MVTNHGIHDWEVRAGLADTGGQNQYVRSLSDTLVSLGFKVTTFNRGGFPDPVTGQIRTGASYKDDHSRIIYLEGGGNQFIRKEDLTREILDDEAKFAQKLILKEGLPIDLIISHYWDAALLAHLIKQRSEISAKHVWVPHSLGVLKRENFIGKPPEIVAPLKFDLRIAYEKEVLPHVDAVASTSGDISRVLKDFYGRESELLLPPCIDTRITYPTKKGPARIYEFFAKTDPRTGHRVKGMNTVLEMSRTDRTKRKDIVIKAFAQALKEHPNTMLLLRISQANKELYDELISLIESLGIRDNIVLLGMVPEKLMADLYATATVYLSPSEMEGFGMSVQEACSCRKPTVSSDLIPFATEFLVKDHTEEIVNGESGPCIIKWGKAGIVVQRGETKGFAHALTRLLGDKKLRENIARNAYNMTIPYFTWPLQTKRLLESMGISPPADSQ